MSENELTELRKKVARSAAAGNQFELQMAVNRMKRLGNNYWRVILQRMDDEMEIPPRIQGFVYDLLLQ